MQQVCSEAENNTVVATVKLLASSPDEVLDNVHMRSKPQYQLLLASQSTQLLTVTMGRTASGHGTAPVEIVWDRDKPDQQSAKGVSDYMSHFDANSHEQERKPVQLIKGSNSLMAGHNLSKMQRIILID